MDCGDVAPLSFVFWFFAFRLRDNSRKTERETKESGATSPQSKLKTKEDRNARQSQRRGAQGLNADCRNLGR